jgi:hypothetical protein
LDSGLEPNPAYQGTQPFFTPRTPPLSLLIWTAVICGGAALLFSTIGTIGEAATLNVQNYGAAGDGTTDDTAAIQNAINDASNGDTVLFPAGTYKVTKTLNLTPGATYQGTDGPSLVGMSGGFYVSIPAVDPVNVVIEGLTFNGAGVVFGQGVTGNVTLQNDTFENITYWSSTNWTLRIAVFVPGSIRNSQILNNIFQNVLPMGSTEPNGNIADGSNTGVMLYCMDSSQIKGNYFDHVGEGIKICFSQAYQTSNDYIGYNTMTNMHRMGIEIQGAFGCGASSLPISVPNTLNLVIEDNSITNFLDPYWESFGVSLADPTPDGADGAIVRHNLIIGGVPSYWAQQGVGGHYGLGIEAGANSLQVYGNVIGGVFDQAISVAVNSYGADVYNNYACKLEPGAGMGIGQETGPSPGSSYSDNTILDFCPATLPSS